MKTSNKLLFSFIGFIVLLMLLSDVVLWANYRNGRSGDVPLEGKDADGERNISLKPFKVVKIAGDENYKMTISQKDVYQMVYWGNKEKNITYSQQGDTLYVHLKNNYEFRLECPEISGVVLLNTSVDMNSMTLPELKVRAGETSDISMNGMDVNNLDIEGGKYTTVHFSGEESEIDSLRLVMGKHSIFKAFDVPFHHTNLQLDSLNELQITGRSLSGMKEVR